MRHSPHFRCRPAWPWSRAAAILAVALIPWLAGNAAAQTVHAFTLINADTDQPVPGYDPFTHGAVLNRAALPTLNLSVVAHTTPATDFGSLRFVLTGATTQSRTENAPPWALAGDSSGDYTAMNFNLGAHTLTATPYPQDGASGAPGAALTLQFTVIHSNLPPRNPPPRVTLVEPAPGARFFAPAVMALAASASDTNGSVAKVEFYADALKLGEFALPPYTLTWSHEIAGVYALTARATDNEGAAATSAPVIVTISLPGTSASGGVTGELKKWHRVSVTFDGPATSETAWPNPFRDYRLEVAFTHRASGKTYRVPGCFAADGRAADTGATSGNQWRAHFAPDETGTWHYAASFRAGADVAAADAATAGVAVGFDGASGSFDIAPTDKAGRDFRGKGRLRHVGKHHLRFAETGEYFLKAGADSPENLLAYADFDATPNVGNRRKTWSPHAAHYDPADAAAYTWRDGRGTHLLGALKYLADAGMNAVSFLTFNGDGDDHNVFPHLLVSTVADYESQPVRGHWTSGVLFHDRFDVSKMEQWDRIFAYADKQGLYLHFKTLETENELLMDGGDWGVERRLYYRELIARFGYHLALNWNLGEEINNASTAQKQAWSQYFFDTDPYRHHQVIHNGANHFELLGRASKLTGFSLQTGPASVFPLTLEYVHRSATSGVPWVVANDEQNPANDGIVTDAEEFHHDSVRGPILWGNLLAGGAGIESYFGYNHPHSDLNCEDFNSRSNWWNQCRYALEFFHNHGVPFWDMTNRDALLTGVNGAHCLAWTGRVYVAYLPTRAAASLNLSHAGGSFAVRWFDPRHGGLLQTGAVSRVSGGGTVSLGLPPANSTRDWVALVTAKDSFASWQRRVFTAEELAQAGVSGPHADPDGDGLSNAAEYAVGGRPLTADPELRPAAALVGDRLTMTYRRRLEAGDVTWISDVNHSLSPTGWQSSPPHLTEQSLPSWDLVQRMRVTDSTAASAAAQRFLRLRLNLEP